MNISSLFLSSDKHLCFTLMAWSLVLLKGCVCESVGVAQKTRDYNYFRTRSVVNKVHPLHNCGLEDSAKVLKSAAYSVCG